MTEIYKPYVYGLTVHKEFIILYKHIGLKVRSWWVLKYQIRKPIIELLKPMLEHHKPMIVVFKHRLEVQTLVCNSETYVCRPVVHIACRRGTA